MKERFFSFSVQCVTLGTARAGDSRNSQGDVRNGQGDVRNGQVTLGTARAQWFETGHNFFFLFFFSSYILISIYLMTFLRKL
jgi:hypothetical protein